MRKILLFVLIAFTIIGCDALNEKEIARVKIEKISNESLYVKEAAMPLKKGDKLAFWVDMDIEYENDIALEYAIELVKDGVSLGGLQLDVMTTNPTFGSVKTTFNGETDWSYSGRLDHIQIEEDGNYVFKVALVSSENAVLKINNAELIFKK
jgi:hypothetical protein